MIFLLTVSWTNENPNAIEQQEVNSWIHEGISRATPYNWSKQAKSEYCSAEAKLVFVIKTVTLSEEKLSAYCREKELCT